MRIAKVNKTTSLFAILVFFSIALIGGSYTLIMNTVDYLVERDAEKTAYGWAKFMSSRISDIDQDISGQKPSESTSQNIELVREVGNVFRFKLFDAKGNLVLVSDELDKAGTRHEELLAKHNSTAAKVVTTGEAYTIVKKGTPPRRPEIYAESYLPIIFDDSTKAVVEVYVDQTKKQNLFRRSFFSVAIAISIFMAIVFFGPALALFFRTVQKRQADKKLQYLAQHDAMTGLMNRTTFLERLQTNLTKVTNPEGKLAVHYIDIDYFKEINDTLGHDIGDKLICEVAARLRDVADETDLICRVGGDEFLLAQLNVSEIADVKKCVRRIIEGMKAPFKVGHHDVVSSVSVGISVAPRDAENAGTLIKRADLALYRVKKEGRGGFKYFEPYMDIELEARRKLERAIRTAAIEETFELFFQPQYKINSEELSGFEALLRFPTGQDQQISPAVFIPIAESMGLIGKIGAWVVQKACFVASNWPENIRIAINLSPLQFKDGDLVGIVSDALERSGLDPHRLELEITEGLLLSNTENVMKQLNALKGLGVSIAMDDFGIGYSSLSYLWKFPFDNIKVDRTFMSSFGEDDNISSILKTIFSLGRSMNMCVTVEGVETLNQVKFLKNTYCDQVQGFYFGRPMNEQDVAKKIFSDFANRLPSEPSKIADLKRKSAS